MPYFFNTPLFHPGELLVSDSVLSRGFDYLPYLRRHLAGDSGEIEKPEPSGNGEAFTDETEILSQYPATDTASIVDLLTIVTTADRSCTVIFLPSDPTE